PTHYALRQDFSILDLADDRLFAASQPAFASEGAAVLPAGLDGVSTVLRGSAAEYTVVSWVPRLTRSELMGAGDDYPAPVRSADLQLPTDLPARVRHLADRISQGAATPYEKALRIQEYLRTNYPYDEDVPPPPAGRDAVDYFLFDTSGGFCSYYASAMVVLLRQEGIPARLATGFARGVWEGRNRRFRVTESEAHAWVEVYFPGYGWVEFEPTPSRSPIDYGAAAPASTSPPPPSSHGMRRAWGGTAALLFVGLATLAGALVAVISWRRGRSPARPLRRLHMLYWRMRRKVAGDGAPHQTPSEFLARHEILLGTHPRLRRATRLLTTLYVRSVYSRRPATAREIGEAQRAWRSAWWERARLGWLGFSGGESWRVESGSGQVVRQDR
ncbi:MAG TPA: transglutaminase domain-containing protein, partial [Anaerolineales bacterium]|nr:transglutaminase domain-containing protein [Anaerolineales bacterium]